MFKIYLILNLIMLPLCLLMCWQESKRRKVSFLGAAGICLLCALFLPIIGYVAGYIFISGISLRTVTNSQEQLLDDKL